MKVIHLNVDLFETGHPDYRPIWDWLTEVGADPAWVKVPSVVKVLKDAVVVEEYLHHKESGELTYKDGKPFIAPVRYEGTPPALPAMTKVKVTDG